MRSIILYAIVFVASVAAFTVLVPPMGFAPSYGPIESPAQPEPEEARGEAAQFMDTPRAKGARPGVNLLFWHVAPGRRPTSAAGLI